MVEEVQQADLEEVQQLMEEEEEIRTTEVSLQSPPTLQKHDTRVKADLYFCVKAML